MEIGTQPGCAPLLVLLMILGLYAAVPSAPGDALAPVTAEMPPAVVEGSAQSADEMVKVYHIINSVTAVATRSVPAQVNLRVSGLIPDGCQAPTQITQRVDGNTVYVEIFRELPANTFCPEIAILYEETIVLEERLRGAFVIDVNGTQIEVNV